MTQSSKTNNVSLQPGDIALIHTLAEDFPILMCEQISELFPAKSAGQLKLRLKRLCHAGYLSSRVLHRIGSVSVYGYYLGPRAPQLFKNPTEQRLARLIRSEAEQLSGQALDHRIMVNSVHIRFLVASRHNPNYKILAWIDTYSPHWKQLKSYGVPVQADAYAEYILFLHFDNLHTFFLELDCAAQTEQAIRRKIDRYADFAQSGAYERLFAARPFRVLFIVRDRSRMESFLKILQAQSSDIFWVTTWPQFKKLKLFDSYWRRPHHKGLFPLVFHS